MISRDDAWIQKGGYIRWSCDTCGHASQDPHCDHHEVVPHYLKWAHNDTNPKPLLQQLDLFAP